MGFKINVKPLLKASFGKEIEIRKTFGYVYNKVHKFIIYLNIKEYSGTIYSLISFVTS